MLDPFLLCCQRPSEPHPSQKCCCDPAPRSPCDIPPLAQPGLLACTTNQAHRTLSCNGGPSPPASLRPGFSSARHQADRERALRRHLSLVLMGMRAEQGPWHCAGRDQCPGSPAGTTGSLSPAVSRQEVPGRGSFRPMISLVPGAQPSFLLLLVRVENTCFSHTVAFPPVCLHGHWKTTR